MYGCESWTIKEAECQRIDAFELWCWPITPSAQEMLPARGGGLTAPTLPEPLTSHSQLPAPGLD